MSLNCDIVMDLVSLYKDGLASEPSRSAVNEHLKGCSACRKYYRHYDAIDNMAISGGKPADEDDYMKHYTEISTKLRRRRGIHTGLIACCACVSAAAFLISLLSEKPLSSKT